MSHAPNTISASSSKSAVSSCGRIAVCILAALLLANPPVFSKEKTRQDKFHGIVVKTGPKAITVKSEDNIYLIRTFNYTPQVEEKLKKKPPQPGKKVTVTYVRGSDLATKVH